MARSGVFAILVLEPPLGVVLIPEEADPLVAEAEISAMSALLSCASPLSPRL